MSCADVAKLLLERILAQSNPMVPSSSAASSSPGFPAIAASPVDSENDADSDDASEMCIDETDL
jgi:hypothetical protein